MKAIKCQADGLEPMYVFRQCDVVDAIAFALYYSVNPHSQMCVPNCVYELAKTMFEKWSKENVI